MNNFEITDIDLDVDDTLTDTNPYLVNSLMEFLPRMEKPNQYTEELFRHVILHGNLHTLAFEDNLKMHAPTLHAAYENVMHNHIFRDGSYMLNVEPIHGMMGYIKNTLSRYIEREQVRLNIVSHRGFHPYGREYTQAYLEKHGVWHLVNQMHILDYREIPDKLVYLRQRQKRFVLVDDNPYDMKGPIDHQKELIIFNHRHPALKRYTNQIKVSNEHELHAQLIESGVIGYK